MVEKKLIQLQDVIKSYPQFKLHCSMELKEVYYRSDRSKWRRQEYDF